MKSIARWAVRDEGSLVLALYPLSSKGGAHQRSYHLLKQIAEGHEIHLVAFNLMSEPEEKLAGYREHLRTLCNSVEFWDLPLRWKGLRWWGRMGLSPWMKHPLSPSAFWSEVREVEWSRVLLQNQEALLHFDSSDLALFA